MGGSVATAIQAVNHKAVEKPVETFTEKEQREITRILGDPDYAPGARAGYLLRAHGEKLRYSPRAKLLYMLLAGFIGADKKRPGSIAVSMKKLASWSNCTTRSAQSAIRELTRSGPLPLLLETPGRPGKVSEYQFVRDPFTVAAAQAADAERTRKHRQPDYSRAQLQAIRAGGADELDRQIPGMKKKFNWMTPTRPAPSPVQASPDPDREQFLAGLRAAKQRIKRSAFASSPSPDPRSGLRP
jgi:hypothetical protein